LYYPLTAAHGDNTYICNITNNIINRNDINISAYIYIAGTDKINQIVIKDNMFDGYVVTDTPATFEDHFSIKYDTSVYYKILAERNVGQMFFTDLTPNVNTNLAGNFLPIGTNLIGWKTTNDVTSDGTYLTVLNKIRTALDIEYVTNDDYLTSPLVINLPSYDGADGLSISFVISGDNGENIRIYASSQFGTNRGIAIADPTNIIYPVRNITNSVDNYFVADTTEQLIHIDISSIYNSWYTSYMLNNKYFPLYLLFVRENNPILLTTLTKTSSIDYEYITIAQITGQFRY
jgi:hypothetical protein